MKYKKKPRIIEAIKFTGNDKEALEFCPIAFDPIDTKPTLIIREHGFNYDDESCSFKEILVSVGDYIIKDESGNFYTLPGDVFEKIYESA